MTSFCLPDLKSTAAILLSGLRRDTSCRCQVPHDITAISFDIDPTRMPLQCYSASRERAKRLGASRRLAFHAFWFLGCRSHVA